MKKVVTLGIWCGWICVSLNAVWAVETVYIEHNSEKQFKTGEPNQVLISSEGEISLGYRTERLLDESKDVWVVNALVQDKGAILIKDVIRPLKGDYLIRPGISITWYCRINCFEIKKMDRVFHVHQLFFKIL